MLVGVIQITARRARTEEKIAWISWKRSVRLMCMPEIFRPLGWRRNHSKIADPVLTTRLPRKVARDSCPTTLTFPKSILWLFSWTWQEILHGVMVKHRNSPFVFRNSSFKWSFSLTVVYKTAVDATDFVHCARLCPVKLFQGFRSREQIVHSSQLFEGDFDLLLP